MITPMATILRSATRQPGEPLNVLTCPVHERYQSGLAGVNAIFYMYRNDIVKDWETTYAPIPPNHVLLEPHYIPSWIDFDLVLSQNKFGNFQALEPIAKAGQIPLISLEHTLPMKEWSAIRLEQLHAMQGDVNIFISEFSRNVWGWGEDDAMVIHHGVDTELFKPNPLYPKGKHILSVVNDWVKRDWCCGFKLWQEIAQGLPVLPIGNTPGLSQAAANVEELTDYYRNAQVFVNTSLISPVPTALLEAMASGCACVSTATCMIPEIIENGVNGFCSNDPAELRKYLEVLLEEPEWCLELGKAARKTIEERFSMQAFVDNWNNILYSTAGTICYES